MELNSGGISTRGHLKAPVELVSEQRERGAFKVPWRVHNKKFGKIFVALFGKLVKK